jgi:hypothetical protein
MQIDRRIRRALFRRRILASSVFLLLLTRENLLLAWGNDGHRFITQEALGLLPSAIRPFFERHQAFVIEHSIDPDLWRMAGFEEETTRHFLDLDAYGSYPFDELPREYQKAVRKFGREKIKKEGLLPWRTAQVFDQLVGAFRQYHEKRNRFAGDEIQFFTAVIAHYVSDAQVPFHAISNYNGQLTGQTGLHFRFESDLLLRYRDRLKIQPAPIFPISNPHDFVFDSLLKCFLQADLILKADQKAAGKRRDYDEIYYGKLFEMVGPILTEQLNASITAVAAMITAAWEQAGKPDLSDDTSLGLKNGRHRRVEFRK